MFRYLEIDHKSVFFPKKIQPARASTSAPPVVRNLVTNVASFLTGDLPQSATQDYFYTLLPGPLSLVIIS